VTCVERLSGGRLTVRDHEIVRYIARHRMVTAEQLRHEWRRRGAPLPHRSAYRRMQIARSFGLVVMERCLVGRPAVFLAAREGLAMAGVENAVPAKVVLATFDHDLAVVDLVRVLEESGAEVITERELWASDVAMARRDGRHPRYCPVIERLADGRVTAVHVPDAVAVRQVADGGEPWAQEVELTLKSTHRLERLVRAYRDADQLAGVVYWTASEQIARAVRSAARRVWAAGPSPGGRSAQEVVLVRPLSGLYVPTPQSSLVVATVERTS